MGCSPQFRGASFRLQKWHYQWLFLVNAKNDDVFTTFWAKVDPYDVWFAVNEEMASMGLSPMARGKGPTFVRCVRAHSSCVMWGAVVWLQSIKKVVEYNNNKQRQANPPPWKNEHVIS